MDVQTRSGKRMQNQQLKLLQIWLEKVNFKKRSRIEIRSKFLDTLLHPTLDENEKLNVIAKGLPASPGAASGKVVFTSDEAERLNGMMQNTILVRVETSPEDIHGMHVKEFLQQEVG